MTIEANHRKVRAAVVCGISIDVVNLYALSYNAADAARSVSGKQHVPSELRVNRDSCQGTSFQRLDLADLRLPVRRPSSGLGFK